MPKLTNVRYVAHSFSISGSKPEKDVEAGKADLIALDNNLPPFSSFSNPGSCFFVTAVWVQPMSRLEVLQDCIDDDFDIKRKLSILRQTQYLFKARKKMLERVLLHLIVAIILAPNIFQS